VGTQRQLSSYRHDPLSRTQFVLQLSLILWYPLEAMATDIRTSELKSPVDIAEYLFTRLHQVGVRSIHGVPGDYNLVALDYIPGAGLKWVGNVNELNAGEQFNFCFFLQPKGA
jgi:hypothetical protein